MKAWVVPEHGGFDVLKIEDRPMPEPGSGEVRIKCVRGALNHLDLWVRRGVPGHKFPLPMIPMSDIAGVVDKCGEGVTNVADGDRVVMIPGVSCNSCGHCVIGDDPLCRDYKIRGESFDGGAVEYLVAPAVEAYKIPDDMTWDVAAAFGLAFLTAYRMVFTRGGVRPGEHVLVHAAGSGVSMAAIQLAKMAGAHVYATAGSVEKIKAAEKFGIERIINYREEDFAKEIRSLTGKRGVDLIIDHVGKDTYQGNIKCLAKGGRLVTCGNTTGPIFEYNNAMIFFKGLSILGSTMGSRDEFMRSLDLVSRGIVYPVVDRVFGFEDLPIAHEYLESRLAFGKVLLSIADG